MQLREAYPLLLSSTTAQRQSPQSWVLLCWLGLLVPWQHLLELQSMESVPNPLLGAWMGDPGTGQSAQYRPKHQLGAGPQKPRQKSACLHMMVTSQLN